MVDDEWWKMRGALMVDDEWWMMRGALMVDMSDGR